MTRKPPDAHRQPPAPLARLRGVLLDLLSAHEVPAARLAGLSAGDWARLEALAQSYHCDPLLHYRRSALAAIPEDLRARWRTRYRASAMRALVLRAELREVTALLEDAGLAPIALKGAWLAWYAYPEPALRPMSDIDLLLTPETVIAGYALLQAHGYRVASLPEMALADLLRFDKHLPELIAPRGTIIELHHRLWEPDGRLDHASPTHDEPAVRARAQRIDGIRYPAPEDMLAHLLIHAAYGHRLNCGPVILTDIAFFLARYPIDWPQFWARAAREGWRAGARLLLAVAAIHGDLDIPLTDAAGPPPAPAILASFPGLILQDRATLQNAALLATGLAGGGRAWWRRLRGMRKTQDGAQAQRDLSQEGGFIGWAVSRLRRVGGQLLHPELLRQSRDLARFSRWLDHY
jgi:hypothetical protein